MDTEYDGPYVHNVQGERSASNIRVSVSHDLGDRTLVVVILLAVVIGVCAVVIGNNVAERRANNDRLAKAEQETRMLEYYVNEVDGKLIHSGFIEPRERWSPEKRELYKDTKP